VRLCSKCSEREQDNGSWCSVCFNQWRRDWRDKKRGGAPRKYESHRDRTEEIFRRLELGERRLSVPATSKSFQCALIQAAKHRGLAIETVMRGEWLSVGVRL
jgi:hypothetical protein